MPASGGPCGRDAERGRGRRRRRASGPRRTPCRSGRSRGSRTTTSRPARAAYSAGGQADRAAAGDDQVTHGGHASAARPRGSVASAASSTRIRTASSAGVGTVKTSGGDPGRRAPAAARRPRRRPRRSWGGAASGRARRRPAPARARRSPGCSSGARGWRCTTSAAPARRAPAASIDQASAGGHLGTADPGLDQRADEQPGVQHDHERVVAQAGLDAAALPAPGGVAGRDDQLGQPLEADQRDQDGEGDQARPRSASRARSSTSSEQKPGPIAISTPWVPGAGGRSRRVSSSTCSTDAEDRLPTRASDSQVSRTASRGTSSAASSASITFGPAGVADPPADVGAGQPVVGEELVDVAAQVALDHRRHLGVEHDPQAAGRRRRSPWCARCRGRAGCGCRAPRPRPGTPAGAGGHDGGGAVAEQPAGHEVGHRDVVALDGQRAQLDGDQHGDVVGVAQRGSRARRAMPAAPATQPSPTSGIRFTSGRSPTWRRDPGVQRGHGEAGHGRRDDQVDVATASARPP